jgi:hypothetical protein
MGPFGLRSGLVSLNGEARFARFALFLRLFLAMASSCVKGKHDCSEAARSSREPGTGAEHL